MNATERDCVYEVTHLSTDTSFGLFISRHAAESAIRRWVSADGFTDDEFGIITQKGPFMNAADRKVLARGRREALKEQGMLLHHKASRFPDRRKQASKDACRGRYRP